MESRRPIPSPSDGPGTAQEEHPSGNPACWWCLEMDCPPELEESLLWRLPALGLSRLAVRFSPERPHQRQLVAWVPSLEWPAEQRAELQHALEPLAATFGLQLPEIRWRQQPEEDWSRSWKRHWRPDPVGRHLLILPAWLDPPPETSDRLVIAMDPGSAFGTGSHPTTRLCLEALETLHLQGRRVADLGCGSGVLGLAALRLGAASVAAVDIDPLAVRSTHDNAALNQLQRSVAVTCGSIEELQGLLKGRKADLLLCNILAPVIEALCVDFHTVLAADGVGLLSGLLVDQAPALIQTLRRQGWSAELRASQSRWGLLSLRTLSDVA